LPLIIYGSFINSTDSRNKILNFNNVHFEPDANLANIVSIYTDNILKIGKADRPLILSASNLTISSDSINLSGNLGLYDLIVSNSLTYTNSVFNLGDPFSSPENIIINFNSSIRLAYLYYNINLNNFNLSGGLNILGDTNITGNFGVQDSSMFSDFTEVAGTSLNKYCRKSFS
jgi:hypothetical protein